jgi:putative heme iron utilization protein
MRHANSRYWVDFPDFGFFRLQPIDIYYVGGFGVMGWVAAEDYKLAAPDPLAAAAPDIIACMNADQADAMILLARRHTGLEATEAAMTSVDRLGFHLRLKTAEGMRGVRINFLSELPAADKTRPMLVEMVRQARLEA